MTLTGTSYYLTSVDLSGQSAVTDSTIEFRVYPYKVGTTFTLTSAEGLSSGDGTPSSYNNGLATNIWYLDYTPAAPAASPATDTTNISFKANWISVSAATNYFLDVSTSNTFGTFVTGYNNLSVGNDTSLNVTGLSPNTVYYYRIRAYNINGTSTNSSTISVTTLKTNQSITFNPISACTYGDADIDPGATASSTLEVAYTTSNSAIADIVNNKIHIVSVGTGSVTIYANQPGNTSYNAAQKDSQTLTISPKSVTITGVTAAAKVYDGTTTAILSGGAVTTGVNTETLAITAGTGKFADKNVAPNISVTATGYALTDGTNGGLAANYSLSAQPEIPNQSITAANLTVSGSSASNKVYDGTTTAIITGGILAGIIGSDVVTLAANTTGIFSSSAVGTGITVTSAMTITGAGAGNYTLTQPALSANITQRPITITANAESKVKGNVDPALTYTITSGNLIKGDELSGNLTREPGDTVGTYPIEIGTLTAGHNYYITFVSANLTIELNTDVMSTAENQLVVYPNPGSDYVYIANIPENTIIYVYNMFGNLVRDKISTSTTEQLEIRDLPSGVYIIKLSGTQNETAIRFIKQ
jgi:hypothetical protein